MDFSRTDDELAVIELAAQICATASLQEPFDAALWARLGDAGLLGIAVPEADGGAGLGLDVLALVAEEIGRVAARAPVTALAALSTVATHGNPELRARLLPSAVAGTSVITAAWNEPFLADALAPRTRALPDGSGWVVTGEKTAVPLAREAAAVLVPATGPEGEPLLLVVDPADARLLDEQTSNGEPAATMLLDHTPADALSSDALRPAYDTRTLALCAAQLGHASAALRMAAAHTTTREQFGRPLATFQAVSVRLGRDWIDVEAMRSTLWQALHAPGAEQVATAAFWACEAGERVLSSAVHLHGGLGVDTDFPLHRWFLAAKGIELELGGAGRQLELLGRAL